MKLFAFNTETGKRGDQIRSNFYTLIDYLDTPSDLKIRHYQEAERIGLITEHPETGKRGRYEINSDQVRRLQEIGVLKDDAVCFCQCPNRGKYEWYFIAASK